jgi:L-lactate dehydrogenase complex protein LldF
VKDFKARIRQALKNGALQEVLNANARRRQAGRVKAFESLPNPDQVRAEARAIRLTSIQRLEDLLDQFTKQLLAKGVFVHRAEDAAQARGILLEIATAHQAKLVVKSKSMVSEEIRMNPALESAGITVVETDLGEYIVQLRGEPPSHIITPALHLKRTEVAETFVNQLGMAYSTDVADLNQAAHDSLREIFIQADVGVSGANFGIAETGTLCLLTNEGNGRMVTTLPRVHIALMGVERVVASLQELSPLLELLPRSATGQSLTSYVSLLHGARQLGDTEGPEERHVILIDNGRTNMLQGPLEEALLCIRCGACLNACPVFQGIGGHAYASPYPGPIGSVISPGMWGVEAFGHLAKASTLCGICKEVCPVEIDLPRLLLELRREYQQRNTSARLQRYLVRLYAWVMTSPKRYTNARQLASLASRLLPKQKGWIRWAPIPLNAWTRTRDFPPFLNPRRSPNKLHADTLASPSAHFRDVPVKKDLEHSQMINKDEVLDWVNQCRAVDGEVIRCEETSLAQQIIRTLREQQARTILFPPEVGQTYPPLSDALREADIALIYPEIPESHTAEQRERVLRSLDEVPVGITCANLALANTGSIVLVNASKGSNLASLLPHLHIAILRAEDIYPDFVSWIKNCPVDSMNGTNVIITGPSRTADIEMTLTIGVHGPTRLMVFLVDQDRN